jgi:hypothetical protein
MTGKSIKVYLDTSLIQGWEEIDAVELVGRDGSRQWAKDVNASSTYASGQREKLGETMFLQDESVRKLGIDSFLNPARPNVWSVQTDAVPRMRRLGR